MLGVTFLLIFLSIVCKFLSSYIKSIRTGDQNENDLTYWMFSYDFKSKNKNSVIKFVNSLKLFGYGYSWGGFESLALYQDKREQGNREYLKLGKDEHLVRLHIGLEDPKDLIDDLKKSLKHVK